MSRSSMAALVACIAAAGPALAQPSDLVPSPADAKVRIVSALGGGARLDRLHALRATGTMEGVSGFPGKYELLARAPASRRVSWDIGYLKQTTAVNGEQGWERSAAVRQLAGEELARARRDGRFMPLYTLLKLGAGFTVAEGQCAPDVPAYLLHFGADASGETFGVDRKSFQPRCEIRTEAYEEGPVQVRDDYGDYRQVKGLWLPFSINETRPEGSLKIRIERYELDPHVAPDAFGNPEAASFADPIAITLATLPERIFKEEDGNYTVGPQRYWGMYFYPSESWSMDVMVKEAHGRFLAPEHARADFYVGDQKVGSQDWGRAALERMRRYPITRFTPQGEIYGFRHNFSVPRDVGVDRIAYAYEAKGPDGRVYSQTLDIPVTTYRPKTRLIFPMKGKFLVTSGHEYYETEHKYERSQQFAIDIVALGDDFQFATNNGAKMEDYVGYARREIIAPADGKVVFARNDIPDGAVKADFLKLPDAITAPAGNVVIIDHGNGEFSIFCHMHHGSVRVKTGDVVRQGQVIGLLGAAGSPGLPHLHYQLQNGPNIFGNDGLPLVFTNIERVGWLGRRGGDDEAGVASVEQPRSGVFMEAH